MLFQTKVGIGKQTVYRIQNLNKRPHWLWSQTWIKGIILCQKLGHYILRHNTFKKGSLEQAEIQKHEAHCVFYK